MGAQILSFKRRVDASPNAIPADTRARFSKVQPNRDSREPSEAECDADLRWAIPNSPQITYSVKFSGRLKI